MNPRQRFKRDRPCPVCGGHADLPQHEGRRCYGYLSDDGRYAHCTRAEHAGRLERNGNDETFALHLQGDGRCGVPHVERATARPLPGGSRDAPSAWSYRDGRLGQPSQLWLYSYADGELAAMWRGGPGRAVARRSVPSSQGRALASGGLRHTSTPLQPAGAIGAPQWRRERKVGPHAERHSEVRDPYIGGLFPNA